MSRKLLDLYMAPSYWQKSARFSRLSPHLTVTGSVAARDNGFGAYSMVSGMKWVVPKCGINCYHSHETCEVGTTGMVSSGPLVAHYQVCVREEGSREGKETQKGEGMEGGKVESSGIPCLCFLRKQNFILQIWMSAPMAKVLLPLSN